MRSIIAAGVLVLIAGAALADDPPPRVPVVPVPTRGAAQTPEARAASTRAFLGLGVVPDAVAAGRGKPLYAESCASCHGPDARGGIGPSLIYSTLVLDDDHGEKLAPFLKVGRVDKGMPGFDSYSDRERADIAEFLHLQVEAYANRGTYENKNNIMVGDARAGSAYFARTCAGCHSTGGDLKSVGAKFRPLDLQKNLIFPTRGDNPARAITATVTGPTGTFSGRVTKLDDFTIALIDAGGKPHVIERDKRVQVAFKDPLEWHKAFAYRLKDTDMTNLTTYLGTLK